MKYPHSVPLWRIKEEFLPGNDILLEQHHLPSSELADLNVQAACGCYQYWPLQYLGIQERGAVSALLQAKRRDFLLP
jgi:hypothetical protein